MVNPPTHPPRGRSLADSAARADKEGEESHSHSGGGNDAGHGHGNDRKEVQRVFFGQYTMDTWYYRCAPAPGCGL